MNKAVLTKIKFEKIDNPFTNGLSLPFLTIKQITDYNNATLFIYGIKIICVCEIPNKYLHKKFLEIEFPLIINKMFISEDEFPATEILENFNILLGYLETLNIDISDSEEYFNIGIKYFQQYLKSYFIF